jgi:hypothetical protein
MKLTAPTALALLAAGAAFGSSQTCTPNSSGPVYVTCFVSGWTTVTGPTLTHQIPPTYSVYSPTSTVNWSTKTLLWSHQGGRTSLGSYDLGQDTTNGAAYYIVNNLHWNVVVWDYSLDAFGALDPNCDGTGNCTSPSNPGVYASGSTTLVIDAGWSDTFYPGPYTATGLGCSPGNTASDTYNLQIDDGANAETVSVTGTQTIQRCFSSGSTGRITVHLASGLAHAHTSTASAFMGSEAEGNVLVEVLGIQSPLQEYQLADLIAYIGAQSAAVVYLGGWSAGANLSLAMIEYGNALMTACVAASSPNHCQHTLANFQNVTIKRWAALSLPGDQAGLGWYLRWGAVAAIQITNAGSGGTAGTYALSFANTSSCTSSPSGTFTVSGGAIASYLLTSGGAGCTATPTVTFPGAGLSSAAGTVILGDNTEPQYVAATYGCTPTASTYNYATGAVTGTNACFSTIRTVTPFLDCIPGGAGCTYTQNSSIAPGIIEDGSLDADVGIWQQHILAQALLPYSATETTYSTFGHNLDFYPGDFLVCPGGGSNCSEAITAMITFFDDPDLSITTSSLGKSLLNVPYSLALAATGGDASYSWAVTAGSLPAGLSLASGGTLSGTPTIAGTFPITITVTDTDGLAASQTFTLVVGGTVARSWGGILPAASVN